MAKIFCISIQVIRADEIKIRNRLCCSLKAKGGAGLILMLKNFIWLFLEKVFWFQKSFPQLDVRFKWFFSPLATSVKHRSAVLFYLPGKIAFLLDVTLPLNDFRVQIPGGVVDIWQSRL